MSSSKMRFKDLFRYLGLRPRSPPSRIFLSVNVMSRRKQSAKAVIKISFCACIVLVIAFCVVYTLLLAYVDNRFHSSMLELPVPYKKIRLLGKYHVIGGRAGSKKSDKNAMTSTQENISDVVWNSSLYYHDKVSLPLCVPKAFFQILITSAHKHRAQRQAIRDSWCSPDRFPLLSGQTWQCIFLVGVPSKSEDLPELIQEMFLYKDMLLGTYEDTYRNLTHKVLHGFHWSSSHCPASYVIKTDDDCFVNTHLVYKFLQNYNLQINGLYVGNVVVDQNRLEVVRGEKNRWSVKIDEYSKQYYPPYASGMGYILSKDVVDRLVSRSAYIAPFPNEDAYVGVVISKLGIKPISSSRFLISSMGLSVCNYLYVFIVHGVKLEAHEELLNKTLKASVECKDTSISTWS
ncbi:beta-1,3-galactosyltransferase 1-like [Physella acuta]|uniref:beta-1,3-galactosyltransferase 1-like n=1 Tax=Physella acuta TaxID=109671 RepID=UPI0027DD05AC|nr:beta-1,3-galactosyltransferase 1-like [Physella acuta]XP_059174979.1 beta-1,3-galactosyltransferase 1-like [Physella acuta]